MDGDADLLAALTAIEKIKDKYPDCGIELGIASECTLGMHGELTYRGKRLAGMWPKDPRNVAQETGVTMFGPAVNVNTTKSVAWNVARACALIKPCMEEAEIPIHPHVGMGVGDPLGMACSHALASGTGGMRTAGDLVGGRQMTRGMRSPTPTTRAPWRRSSVSPRCSACPSTPSPASRRTPGPAPEREPDGARTRA